MKTNEQDDAATPRAGGDVIWKSASQASPAESADGNTSTASNEASESETGAGGDVIINGASKNQTESQ